MSKFIATSVNYSETNVLKSKYLSNILELYNQEIISEPRTLVNNTQKYIIPNNDSKYYLLIVNKNDITPNNINTKYKICYFFPEKDSSDTLLTKNSKSDFYVEIDNYKTTFNNNNYLFEGYLYNVNQHKTFLITDILAIDSKLIKCDYSLRYSLIYKLLKQQNLHNLNGHLTIDIHSIFELDSEVYDTTVQTSQLFNIFKNNFIFKDEILAIETIIETSLKKHTKVQKNASSDSLKKDVKIITKGKYIDVYNVCNKQTNNHEGILYIKGLNESKKIRKMFDTNDYVELECSFNQHFKKWQPNF
jgi:hypothetical protein